MYLITYKHKRSKKILILSLIALLLVGGTLASLFFIGGSYFYNYALNPKFHDELSTLGNIKEEWYKNVSESTITRNQEANKWYKLNVEKKENIISIYSLGAKLQGYYLKKENSHNYVILVHGYKGAPSNMALFGYEYYLNDFNVIFPANRGHDISLDSDPNGKISMGYYDKWDILEYAKKILKEDKEAKFILHGVSMGAATVMMASSLNVDKLNVKAIVEDRGYTSVYDIFNKVAKEDVKIPPFPILNGLDYFTYINDGWSLKEASAVNALKNTNIPMFFVHGEDDGFVPFRMLDENINAYLTNSENKNHYEKLVIKDAQHGNSSLVGYDENKGNYFNNIFDFIAKYL